MLLSIQLHGSGGGGVRLNKFLPEKKVGAGLGNSKRGFVETDSECPLSLTAHSR